MPLYFSKFAHPCKVDFARFIYSNKWSLLSIMHGMYSAQPCVIFSVESSLFVYNMASMKSCFLQWGRRLEDWSNTAARRWLRRVTLQGSFCMNCPADWIYSWCYKINVHNHPSWAMSRKEDMAWYSSIDPCILSGFLSVGSAHTWLFHLDKKKV